MADIYRLRSIDRLLGKDNKPGELETQTIYFASPEQLNDPMEGFRDIVWRGDHIIWTNLLRHYVYCLHGFYNSFRIGADSVDLTKHLILVHSSWTDPPAPEFARLFGDIWAKLATAIDLTDISHHLASTKQGIRRDELLFFLHYIHLHAISAIDSTYADRGIAPRALPNLQLGGTTMLRDTNFFSLRDTPDSTGLSPDEIFAIVSQVRQSQAIRHSGLFQERLQGPAAENLVSLLVDFPDDYVTSIVEGLLWPSWYAVCFSKSPYNSSLWGSYADSHRGACLKFSATDHEGQMSLDLREPDGSPRKERFHDVQYSSARSTVDFFRNIGTVPHGQLVEQWLTDEEGNLSDCAVHLQGDDAVTAWREEYWNHFYQDIAQKTKDWEHEAETRLLLNAFLDGTLPEEKRKLTYDFKVLCGIIFGIRTTTRDKLRIIEVVRKKCAENDVDEFQFEQAHVSPQDGQMKSYPLRIDIG